ncbi:MAG: hypothetical protein PHQ83_09295 [Eubacteriales bacterium]|nr:hypothetical protein [Eubacteriales bacterium]
MLPTKFYLGKILNTLLHLTLIAVLVLFVFVLVNQSIILPLDSKVFVMNDVEEYPIGGIQGENPVSQTITASQEIARIGIKMATYGRINPGDLYFRVYDPESGETYHEEAISAAEIVDNNFHEFTLAQPLPARKSLYAFEVSGITTTQGQSIGLWSTRENSYSGGKLYYGEYETEGDLSFYLVGTQSIRITSKILMSIGLSILILVIFIGYLNIQSRKGRSANHV